MDEQGFGERLPDGSGRPHPRAGPTSPPKREEKIVGRVYSVTLVASKELLLLFVCAEVIAFLFFWRRDHSGGRRFASHLFHVLRIWRQSAVTAPPPPWPTSMYRNLPGFQNPKTWGNSRFEPFFFFKELWNPFLNKIWGNPTRRVRVANGAVLGALPALLSSRHRLLRLGHNLQTKNLYNFSHLISEKTAHSTKSTADPK